MTGASRAGRALIQRSKRSGEVLEPVPDEWRTIAETSKVIVSWPVWRDPPAAEPAARELSKDKLHTRAAETTEFVVPLGEKDGPGLEGVRLRVSAWAYERERDVTANLEVSGGRSFVTIARVDAWPSDPHVNTRWRDHPKGRHLPGIIDGHHVHRFADNAPLGRPAFGPLGNLPIAVPVGGGIRSFRDFLRTVSAEFRIAGLDDIDTPEGWRRLI